MNQFNTDVALSFTIAFTALFVMVYLVPKQMKEVLSPKDWLTGLRWQILLTLVFSIIGLVPSVVYLGFRSFGIESEDLRSVASIAGNLSRLANVILLVMIFNYKKKS